MEKNKIKLAIIKFGGLSSGGTEKFLQTIAVNLNKEEFDVTFFYCDAAPHKGSSFMHPDTNQNKKKYLEEHKVKLVKFNVGLKDLTSPFHKWIETNFWELFNEKDYNIIQTGRAGHKEFPFNKIKYTPIVDSIHLTAGVDNQFNISRVMHICNWNAGKWKKSGGDASRTVLVSHPMEINEGSSTTMREKLKIGGAKIVFGFHQRDAESIFSPLPLEAYKLVENESNHFILMGGSGFYRKQAKELGIKNISFVDHNADSNVIYSFLKTLDVYAHGRKDGEVNSTAMAEAMYFGLPIVSHTSKVNNGHIECIGDAGKVVITVEEYANELKRLQSDKQYLATKQEVAKKRFQENYELSGQMKIIENIYKSVIKDPFPFPWRRRLYALHWTQNIRIWMKWVYLKSKYYLLGRV